jgi:hypothetical protein
MGYTHNQVIEACDALVETGDLEAFKTLYAELKERLEKVFLGNWHFDDIQMWFDDRYADDYDPLTEEEIKTIAYYCERYFDAEVGMNWDVIDSHMYDVLESRGDK